MGKPGRPTGLPEFRSRQNFYSNSKRSEIIIKIWRIWLHFCNLKVKVGYNQYWFDCYILKQTNQITILPTRLKYFQNIRGNRVFGGRRGSKILGLIIKKYVPPSLGTISPMNSQMQFRFESYFNPVPRIIRPAFSYKGLRPGCNSTPSLQNM